MKDKTGTEFDPEIHAAWKTGEPRITNAGVFQRKPPKRKKKVVEDIDESDFITNQLIKSVKQFKYGEKKIDGVRALADNLTKMAIEDRDKWAMQFVIERIEGKAVQKTESKHKHTVEVIRDFSEDPEEQKMIDVTGEVVESKREDPELIELMNNL